MERIANLLPVGREDREHHRGARRRSQRFPLNADVTFVEPAPAEGIVLNASAGGLRVTADRAIPVGELCVVDVIFSDDRHSIEHARVVWSRHLPDGWVLGLEFVNLN